jgi:glycosyltransferase involved in cell wall biosynthesis
VLMAHPSPELYGSDRVFLESVGACVAAGWRVVVTLPRNGPLVEALRDRGARVVRCATPVLRKAALRPAGFVRLLADTTMALVPMLRLLADTRPDVVYVNTVTVPLWPVLARITGRTVVAHVHEAEDAVPAPVRAALAAPLLAATAVVVNSRATAQVVTRAFPLLRRRIRLVYNGVPGPLRHQENGIRPHDPIRIVLVGRLSPRKGTDLAIDALARLRADGHRVTLDVVGSVFTGYEWYEHELHALIRRHELEDSVRLLGFCADVWAAYRRADIAVVPSRVEPFGNTSVEAQLAGLPVVVTAVQGLPETVDNGRTGHVVAPDDPAALADGLATVIEDWPAAVATAERAREHALRRFAPARYAGEITAIIAETATRQRKRRAVAG